MRNLLKIHFTNNIINKAINKTKIGATITNKKVYVYKFLVYHWPV